MRQIAQDTYVETGYRGVNVGFVVTGEGVILVDTPMIPAEARRWREVIAQVTDQEIAYVINTDYRRERILGNQFFSAPVVAHELAWERMKDYDEAFRQQVIASFRDEPEVAAELTALRIVAPQVTFTDRMTIYRGGKTIQLIHIGGPTPATSLVYIPEEGVLFAGDVVVNGMHPFMEEADSKQWLRALNYVRRPWIRAEIIVPGRGEVCGKEDTYKLSEYIRHLRSRVRSLYRAGWNKAEVTALITETMDIFPVAEEEKEQVKRQLKANVERLCEEIKAKRLSGTAS